jgi:hypothetical protein
MFATPQSLQKRTGKSDLNRPAYLKQLVDEYKNEQTTDEKREQVLANLANFAYDPINYEYFRRFDIIDLFIGNLEQFHSNGFVKNDKLLTYSLAAISNLCLDPKNKDYLIKNNAIQFTSHYLLLAKLDEINNLESILISLTFLIFMMTDTNTRLEILNNKNLIQLIKQDYSKSSNKRLSNLANLFIDDYLNTNEDTK